MYGINTLVLTMCCTLRSGALGLEKFLILAGSINLLASARHCLTTNVWDAQLRVWINVWHQYLSLFAMPLGTSEPLKKRSTFKMSL